MAQMGCTIRIKLLVMLCLWHETIKYKLEHLVVLLIHQILTNNVETVWVSFDHCPNPWQTGGATSYCPKKRVKRQPGRWTTRRFLCYSAFQHKLMGSLNRIKMNNLKSIKKDRLCQKWFCWTFKLADYLMKQWKNNCELWCLLWLLNNK